jgi:hypothetical protein
MLRLIPSLAILSLCFLIMQSQAQQTSSMRSHTAVPTASSMGLYSSHLFLFILNNRISLFSLLFLVVRSCASNPCLNGGLCLDYPNGFVCRCQAPWVGRICNSYQGTAATFTRSIVKSKYKLCFSRTSDSNQLIHYRTILGQASGQCSANTCKKWWNMLFLQS